MIRYTDIGLRPYLEVLALQRRLHAERMAGDIPDTIIFCEHPPVFTVGRQDCRADWLSSLKTIAESGIDVVQTDRGGRITYHGPGQLIGYLIFNIGNMGVRGFVRAVEEVCLRTLARFDIKASRDEEHPGLWVGGKKIVALGFHISHGVSKHGFALNVEPDLSHYGHIVPCGISSKGVTSIREQVGNSPAICEVKDAVMQGLQAVFCQPLTASTDEKVKSASVSSSYALI